MPLSPGTTLGPYEIQAPLGAGGMGEVYKARDTRLDRTVAIKVLPEHVAADPDLKQRFEREARTVAALNHPHICTLHDIGNQDGIDFLVMEYLDGETLAQRLEQGALPLDQALQIATEIADALDKAHRQGIVHRDLKPGNIMLTKAGSKLLDFGLAKLRDPGAEATRFMDREVLRQGADVSTMPEAASPGVYAPLTNRGTVLGTFQYMAPEQLEGREADARTDIFSFGATFYEVVSGRKAFPSHSQASLIGAILVSDPPAIGSVMPTTPPMLDWLLQRCLAKDRDERWQTTCDLVAQLRVIATGVPGNQADPPAVRTSSGPWLLVSLCLAGIVIAATVLIPWWIARESPSAMVTRVLVDLPSDQFLPSGSTPIALSPDGSVLAYVALQGGRTQLYVRELGQFAARPIPGTEGADAPFFSPNGEWIGFFADRRLRKVPASGGEPITLCPVEETSHGVSWGQNDTIVFALEGVPGLMQVPGGGGTPTAITTVDSAAGHRSHSLPQVLPGGDTVLFTIRAETGTLLALLSLATGEVHELSDPFAVSGARYVPSGHLVYARNGGLWAIGFDLSIREVVGSESSIFDGLYSSPSVGAAHFATSDTGTLVYVPGNAESLMVWVDRDGRTTVIPEEPRPYWYPRVSPDGSHLAVVTRSDRGSRDVWIYDLGGRRFRPLTVEGSNNIFPVWAPDGSRISFASGRLGSMNLFSKPVVGGDAEVLLRRETSTYPLSWSRDGRFLAFYERHPTNNRDIWLLEAGGEPVALITTEFNEKSPVFSPNGRWLAYVSDQSGRDEVYVVSATDPSDWQLISPDGGSEPVWAPTGAELFYRRGYQAFAVPVATGSSFGAGNPEQLFEGRFEVAPGGNQNYDVAPDGRFLMLRNERGSAPTQLNVVLNWFEELKARVPTP